MKTKEYIKVANTRTVLFNRVLPINAVYGRVSCMFNRGFTLEQRDIWFVLLDRKPADIGNRERAYWVAVCDETGRWFECATNHSKAFIKIRHAIDDFLFLHKNLPTQHDFHDIRVGAPREKRAQVIKDSSFGINSVGYTLSTHVMTDDVVSTKRRRCVTYTNFAR